MTDAAPQGRRFSLGGRLVRTGGRGRACRTGAMQARRGRAVHVRTGGVAWPRRSLLHRSLRPVSTVPSPGSTSPANGCDAGIAGDLHGHHAAANGCTAVYPSGGCAPAHTAARRTGPAAGAGRWQHLAGRCARRAGGSAAGVAAQYAQAPKAVLALDGADDANYRAFTVALAAARNAGFGDIAIRR